MNIVLLESLAISREKLSQLAAPFEAQGHQFTAYDDGCRDTDELIRRAKDADVLMIANSPLPPQVVDACPRLRLISVAFTGVDHVPMELCKEKGILVCNCAGYSTDSVAELVFGLVFGLLRRISACDTAARSCGTKAGLVGFELKGKTFGVVGAGAIGGRVAQLAKAFGCRVVANRRSVAVGTTVDGVEYLTLEQLLAQSDIVSLHVPATAETKGLIDKEKLALMKPTALLINTARGVVVDNAALADALRAGKLAGAGIDVFEMEPPIPADHPLTGAPNTILTPHVAFATAESMEIRGEMVFENVRLWMEGHPRNIMG